MHLVWPLAALFGSVIWLGVTYRWGRTPQQDGAERAKLPSPVMVLKGASRCGTGCVLGDIIAEWSALLAPAIAMSLGWGTLFADKMFAVWIADYLVAYVLGIAFQYFTIRRCGTCPRHRGCGRRSRRIRCPSPRRSACTARWRWCSSRCSARRSAARHRSIARILVRHASGDAGRLRHRLPDELVADPLGGQGEDVSRKPVDREERRCGCFAASTEPELPADALSRRDEREVV